MCFRLLISGLLIIVCAGVQGGEPKLGAYQLERTLTDVLGEQRAAGLSGIWPPDRPVSWEIVVPESYDPASPAGLLVYISPLPHGRMPPRWEKVLAAKNLIWVSANKAGNSVNVQRRALFAVIAPTLIRSAYVIDPQRIYVTGLSGGGKMASMVATDHANLFKGAIYNCGVEFWDRHPPRRFEEIKQNRYVFITGEHDQARRPTRRVHGRYRKAGVTGVKLMVIPGMGHENPPAKEFAEAIDFLDARLGPASAPAPASAAGDVPDG